MSKDVLDRHDVAQLVGLSYDRFRKVWQRWVRELGFPAPFMSPDDGGNYAWRREPILAWREARERALGVGRSAPQFRPGRTFNPNAGPKIQSQRAEARRLLMGEA